MKNEETLFLFAKAIKSLIKKQPLDKITVTDIVSTAGKTRQTFYRHFQDKYDLVNWYFEKLVLKSFEEMNQGGSLQEALNLKFAFIMIFVVSMIFIKIIFIKIQERHYLQI